MNKRILWIGLWFVSTCAVVGLVLAVAAAGEAARRRAAMRVVIVEVLQVAAQKVQAGHYREGFESLVVLEALADEARRGVLPADATLHEDIEVALVDSLAEMVSRVAGVPRDDPDLEPKIADLLAFMRTKGESR